MTIADQKVREKLADITREFFAPKISEWRKKGTEIVILPADELALTILQSPDLRVTLVPKKYMAVENHVYFDTQAIAQFYGTYAAHQAVQYAEFLNSKEPKS